MRNWILVAAILLVVGLIGMGWSFGGDGLFNLGGVDVEQHQEADAGGVKHIEIETGSVDLTVVRGGSNAIRAELTGKASKNYTDKIKLTVEKEGDTVKVGVDNDVGFNFGISILNLDLRLELPEAQYESVTLDAGSGRSSFSGLTADTVKLTTGSGDMRLEEVAAAKRLSVTVGSGNTHAEEVTAGTADFKAASGDITVETLKADDSTFKISSGNIRLSDAESPIEATAASGDIRIELKAADRPMTLKTSSGDVSVDTEDRPASLQVRFAAGSGDLHNHWDADDESSRGDVRSLVFGDGATEWNVTTGSGDFSLGRR